MTLRRDAFSDIGRMTFDAAEAGVTIALLEFRFDGRRRVCARLVATGAGSNRHVGFQAAQTARARDIDVTGRAFQNMIFGRVTELEREPLWN